MEEIDAESVKDCTDESVMEFLESTKERDASVTAEFVKAEVLSKVTFAMSEKDPALRVVKAVADFYSLHRNLRLDFINGKAKKAVEHLVSVFKPATLKALIESKLEMDKSELKKDFLEFVGYLKTMAGIHDEHCHVVEHKKTDGSGMKNNGKSSDAGSRSSGHNSGGSPHGGASNKASGRDRTKSGHGRSSNSTGSSRLASTWTSERARSTTCLTVLTLGGTKLWPCSPSTRRRGMPTRKGQTSKLWGTTERRRTTEMARPRISPRTVSESRSRYWQTQALLLFYTAQCCGGRKEVWLPSQCRGVAGAHHAKDCYQGLKRQEEVQRDGDAHVGGDGHYAVGDSVHAWSATDHCRRRYGPSIDRKAGLRRDGFSGKSESGLCAGKIPPARLQPHWRRAIGDGQEALGRPVKASTHARSHSRVYLGLAGYANTGKEKKHEASVADEAERA
jgi:hypothetical protein